MLIDDPLVLGDVGVPGADVPGLQRLELRINVEPIRAGEFGHLNEYCYINLFVFLFVFFMRRRVTCGVRRMRKETRSRTKREMFR